MVTSSVMEVVTNDRSLDRYKCGPAGFPHRMEVGGWRGAREKREVMNDTKFIDLGNLEIWSYYF